MTIKLYKGDLPDDLDLGNVIAVDTETMGLLPQRDRLCLVQISSGDGSAHLVQLAKGQYDAPNLKALLGDQGVTKIFHYARFDVAIIKAYLGVDCGPIFCTKIASKLCRTYTDRHGLREVVRHATGTDLNKQQQSSDWGADELDEDQLAYAASDVLYLHQVMSWMEERLVREDRMALAQQCFDFISARAELDLLGWNEVDIFAHY